MFHPLPGKTLDEQRAGNVREFTGDGSPYLRVPGCLAVEEVRVGALVLPDEHEYQVPVTLSDPPQIETRFEPTYQLQHLDDGTPILLRNIHSNNGIWQSGAKVYVTGRWAEPVVSEPSGEPPAGDK